MYEARQNKEKVSRRIDTGKSDLQFRQKNKLVNANSIPLNRNSIQFMLYKIHKSVPLIKQEKEVDKNNFGRMKKITDSFTEEKIGENRYRIYAPTLPNLNPKADSTRRGNIAKVVNQIIKNPPQAYIGGHLIKDEWGGKDNMFNVVSWKKDAEERWTQRFENEITKKFLSNEIDELQIDISVLKKDELIDSNKFKSLISSIAQDKSNSVDNMIVANEGIRWKVNKAGETIPKSVIGNTTPTIISTVSINSNDSGFDDFIHKAETYITSNVKDKRSKVDFETIRNAERKKLHNERTIALQEEYEALMNIDRNSYFFQNIEPGWNPTPVPSNS